jgi:hypothetical protein
MFSNGRKPCDLKAHPAGLYGSIGNGPQCRGCNACRLDLGSAAVNKEFDTRDET